ncbi:hypothetical protein MN608_07655 [Microdochium nivale]|nr:hypothetical protein MN608_07655 [Microdochium nivale]
MGKWIEMGGWKWIVGKAEGPSKRRGGEAEEQPGPRRAGQGTATTAVVDYGAEQGETGQDRTGQDGEREEKDQRGPRLDCGRLGWMDGRTDRPASSPSPPAIDSGTAPYLVLYLSRARPRAGQDQDQGRDKDQDRAQDLVPKQP